MAVLYQTHWKAFCAPLESVSWICNIPSCTFSDTGPVRRTNIAKPIAVIGRWASVRPPVNWRALKETALCLRAIRSSLPFYVGSSVRCDSFARGRLLLVQDTRWTLVVRQDFWTFSSVRLLGRPLLGRPWPCQARPSCRPLLHRRHRCLRILVPPSSQGQRRL